MSKRARLKFPYLYMVSEELADLEYRDEKKGGTTVLPGTQGRLEISFYKGSVIFAVQDGNFPDKWAVVWLAGDALDALATDLKVRRRQWHAAYKRAAKGVHEELSKPFPDVGGLPRITPDARGITPGGRKIRRGAGKAPRILPTKKTKKSKKQ